MPSGSSAQLIVDAPALMTFRADNVEAAGGDDAFVFFSANLSVLFKDLFEALALFVRRFIQLFANLFYHAQVFLPLCGLNFR